MVKRRIVVVLSPKPRKFSGLCTVIPLSTTPPDPIERHHLLLSLDPELPHPYQGRHKWVKGDMLYTLSLERLDRPHLGKDRNGRRQYLTRFLPADDFAAVQACALAALGLPP